MRRKRLWGALAGAAGYVTARAQRIQFFSVCNEAEAGGYAVPSVDDVSRSDDCGLRGCVAPCRRVNGAVRQSRRW